MASNIISVEINKPYNVSPILSSKSAFLTFDYDPKIVDYIKSIPYNKRSYNPKLREWEIEESLLPSLIKAFSNYQFRIHNKISEDESNKILCQIPENYNFGNFQPFNFQREAITKGINTNNLLLADDMGCIDGDAIIDLHTPRKKIKLSDLYKEFKNKNPKDRWNTRTWNNHFFQDGEIIDVLDSGIKECIKIITETGRELILTPDHKIFTDIRDYDNGHWIEAKDSLDKKILCDKIFHKWEDKFEKVIKIESAGKRQVYDIKINEPFHNFLANGIVVHNCGKTMEAYHITNIHSQNKVLVVVCSSVLKYNWKKEILKIDNGEQAYILGEEGDTKGKLEDKKNDIASKITFASPYKYFITNKELFSRNEDACKLIREKIKMGIIDTIVIDEAHLGFTSPKNKFSKAMLKMEPKYKMIVTGTPMKNVPTDFYCYLKWFGLVNQDYWHFENELTVKNEWGSVVEYVHPEKIAEKIKPYMIRRKKEEVIDELPERTFVNEVIEMTPEHDKLYRKIINDIVENKNEGLKIKERFMPEQETILGEIVNAQKCTSLPIWCDDKFDEKKDNKLKRIEELLETITQEGNKSILFSHFTTTTNFYREYFKKYNPAYITGELSAKAKSEQEDKLNNDDSCKLCIISQAGGQGLNLIKASYLIMVDYPWNNSNYSQIIDRTYRIGQKKNCTVINMIYKDTIDEQQLDLINNRGIMSECMVNGSEKINVKKLLQSVKAIMKKQLIKKKSVKSRFENEN